MTLGVTGAGLAGQISIVSAPASAETSQGDAPNGGEPGQLSGPVEPADAAYLIAGAWGPSLKAAGYEQREYFASGTAYSYQATGPENNAGTWRVAPATSASLPHSNRGAHADKSIAVQRDSGRGVAKRQRRRGWRRRLGVLVTRVGTSGVCLGGRLSAAGGNRQPAPKGSGALWLTDGSGDQYSYDIFTQAARALLVGGHANPLAPLHPKRLLAVGESQSALYLTTYIDAIQPLYHVFDGFLVHSRAGGAVGIPGASPSGSFGGDVHIRTDIGVPVLMMITETDETFGGYYQARQPDTRFIRLWDVAGASHADSYIVTPQSLKSLGCASVDEAPSHFIFEAALSAINTWMVTGSPPPSAPRMQVQVVDGTPTVQTNTSGTAIGGIQGPWERVPIAAYSNTTPPGSAGFCVLFGSTRPFSEAQLKSLYGTKSSYLKAFATATDEDIKAGYILLADKAQVLAFAKQVQF